METMSKGISGLLKRKPKHEVKFEVSDDEGAPDALVTKNLVVYAPRVAVTPTGHAMPGFTPQIVSRRLVADLSELSGLNITQATATFDKDEHLGRFCLVHYCLEEWNIEIDIVYHVQAVPEQVLEIMDAYHLAMAQKVLIMTREKQDFREVDKTLGQVVQDWKGLLNSRRPLVTSGEHAFVLPFLVAAQQMVTFPVHLDSGAKLFDPTSRQAASGSPTGLRPAGSPALIDPIRQIRVPLVHDAFSDNAMAEPVSCRVDVACPSCSTPAQLGDRYCRRCGAVLWDSPTAM
jgi:predicted nucleic acid-binding protein